jgi:tetratricopeptide (TPR) repeat protein
LFQRVLLRGLSQQDVGRFIEVAAGVDPPAGLAEAVHTQTEGNPLFVTEVVRLLVQEGELTQESGTRDSWTVRIPEGVREVIGRRLNRLSQRCNESLTIASVIGREFELRQLAPLVEDMSEDRLLEVLEEALAARVIEELPQAVGRYQFTHALIQETLAEELTLTRRVRLHARIGETLEQLYGDNADAHATELAHHFAEAEAVLGTDKLVRYSLLAGERALASYAYEESLSHFQQALTAKGVPLTGTEPAKDAEAAALLYGLGKARLSTQERRQVQEAVDTLGRSFDYYERTGDVARAVTVAEYPLPALSQGRTGIAQFVARALELVPPDSQQAGRLLSTYGAELGRVENDHQGAEEAFDRALAIARREGDLALELRTLAASANVDLFHLRLQGTLEKARQIIELADSTGNDQAAWSGHLDSARALDYIGELESVKQHASAALELAEKLHDRYRLALAFRVITNVYYRQGDWQRARDLSDSALGVAPQDVTLLSQRVMLEYGSGDFSCGEAYLERLLKIVPPLTSRPGLEQAVLAGTIPSVARITGVFNQLDLAVSAAQIVLASPFPNPMFTVFSRAALGLVAVLRGDVAAAGEHYGILAAANHTTLIYGATDRLLGLLAHTMGKLDQAAAHFEDSLAFCRKAGYRPELAWTCCDYADTLLQRSEPGDREKATSLLDESLAISSELGMRPLMERVLSRRNILKA